MEISKDIHNSILSYLKYALQNPDYEFEAVLNSRSTSFNPKFRDISSFKIDTSEKFRKIMKYFRINNEKYENITDMKNNITLDIRMPKNEGYKKYRMTITGKENIKHFCKTNKYKPELMIYSIKDTPDKINYPLLDIEDYNLRINLKKDIIFDEVKSKNDKDKIISLKRKINALMQTQIKSFRYKQRFTFLSKTKYFKIDMTIVRSSTKNSLSKYLYNSGTFKSLPNYELEIELNHDALKDKNPDKIDYSKLSTELYQIITNILIILNKSPYIIPNKEFHKIRSNYVKLAKNLSDTDLDNIRYMNAKEYFINPKPIAFKLHHLLPKDNLDTIGDDYTFIYDNYTITDKADGVRHLLFINDDTKVYLINNSMNIIFTGLKHPDINTILDGELIENTKTYLAFDVYFHKNKSVSEYPLYDSNTKKNRLEIIDKITKDKSFVKMKTGVNISSNFIKFSIKMKNFEIVSIKKSSKDKEGKSNLFAKAKKILNDASSFNYNIDGLIFTPANLPVGANKENDKPRLFGTWNKTLKWKPPNELTIDFLLEKKTVIELNDKPYMLCFLRVSFNGKEELNIYEILSGNFSMNEEIANSKKKFAECYIPVIYNELGEPIIKTINGEIIYDDTIVEFSYEESNDDIMFNWKPYRIRHDKTELYRLTRKIDGTANYISIAEDTYDSILEPVTKNMITGIENIDVPSILDKISTSKDDNTNIYYKRDYNTEIVMSTMYHFHSVWIKGQFLYSRFASTKGNKTNLFEIASGVGGDMGKWIKYGFTPIIASDISTDNLYGTNDGLYKRYLGNLRDGITSQKKQKMIFLKMDASKKWDDNYIRNNSDPISSEIGKVVFKIYKSQSQISEKALVPYYNMASKKFKLVSCMFAIHYMFENNYTLDNLCENINSVIAKGGYFIGTTFDANLVNQLFQKNDNVDLTNNGNPVIRRFINDKLAFSIEKIYDTLDDDPNKNIGKEIRVYVEKINEYHNEFLVDFQLLRNKLEKFDIKPLNNNDLKELGLDHSSDSFEYIFNHYIQNEIQLNDYNKIFTNKVADKMNDVMKEFSFLNRWFIFKKY
jgi:hypothetical protein